MADGTLATRTAAATLDGTELYYTVQGGADRKATGAQIKTLVSNAPTIAGHPTIEGVTATGATGTGKLVFDTGPTLSAPVLGTPASGTLSNCTGLPAAGVVGTALVVSGALGTPASGTLSNCTGLPIAGTTGYGTGVATALAATLNGSGAISATTSPTFVTPVLGAATATSINKVAITSPGGSPDLSATITVASGKTLTASNSITLAGTDSTTMTFPPASASIGYINVPINGQNAGYTCVAADSGKCIVMQTAGTFTIPAEGSVNYALGTVLTFINNTTSSTIPITSDTMTLANSATTGTRTLAAKGIATAIKIASATWIISGTGLT